MTLLHPAAPPVLDQPAPDTVAVVPVPPQRTPADAVAPAHAFDAPAAAEAALAAAWAADRGAARDAIVWLSAHLAALHGVIYPVAARHVPGTSPALRDQQHRSRALALLLRRLHAQLSGDGAAAAEDVPSLRGAVLGALREHTAGEQELTGLLRAALTSEQWQELVGAYRSRLRSGPTRPHPHTPGTGLVGRLAYGMSARVDRVLDVLDSRIVRPVPAAAAS
jgi:hypothetical protein